jgi:predicted DNA-binding ribbon-helix-helix protein
MRLGDAGMQLAMPSAGVGPVRSIKLDTHTADQLEAMALARGLSVAELLAEFVAREDATPPGFKTKQARAS